MFVHAQIIRCFHWGTLCGSCFFHINSFLFLYHLFQNHIKATILTFFFSPDAFPAIWTIMNFRALFYFSGCSARRALFFIIIYNMPTVPTMHFLLPIYEPILISMPYSLHITFFCSFSTSAVLKSIRHQSRQMHKVSRWKSTYTF